MAGPIDTVSIAASTSTSAENLRHAADAGDAALCKKPIDLDLGHALDVVGYATEHNARAMVDLDRRFDRNYAELKRLVGQRGDRPGSGETATASATIPTGGPLAR